MKIEAGRYYRTRDGLKVGPIARCRDPEYPWIIPNISSCNDSGRISVNRECPEDLIAEWTDEPVGKTHCGVGDEIDVRLKIVEVSAAGRAGVRPSCCVFYPTEDQIQRHIPAPRPIEAGSLVHARYDGWVRCRVEHIIDGVAWVHPVETSREDALRPVDELRRIDDPAEASS